MKGQIKKLKNFFSSKNKNKKIILFLIFFLLSGLFPSKSNAVGILTIIGIVGTAAAAGAGLYFFGKSALKWASATVGQIIISLVASLFYVLTNIAWYWVQLSMTFLKAAINRKIITFSYTRLDNSIINLGWNLTKDLANMAIVVFLVVIALATILGIKEYQYKKTLPILIVIALLINFSPVIMGLVVDAANILMDFFLKDFTGSLDIYADALKKSAGDTGDGWRTVMGKATESGNVEFFYLNPLISTIIIFFYFLISGFLFLIFAIIFLARYVAIWTAVILSPLAFVAYILPATKQFFSKWLNFFLSWCFIGLVAAFFLYLSGAVMSAATKGDLIGIKFDTKETSVRVSENLTGQQEVERRQGASVVEYDSDTWLAKTMNDLLPYIVSMVFMYIALTATLSINAMGSNMIISAGNRVSNWGSRTVSGLATGAAIGATGAVTGAAGYVAGRTIAKARETLITPGMQERMTNWETRPRWGEGETGFAGWAKRTLNAPYYHLRRTVGGALGSGNIETEKNIANNIQRANEGLGSAAQASNYHRVTTAAEKIGVLNAAIKDGNLDDLIERFNVSQQEIRDLINQGRQWNIHGTIEKAAPHLIKEDITDENRENELIIRDRNSERVRNIVSRMKPADYGNIANAALEDIDVLDAMIDTATGNHIRELIEKKGLAAVNALEGRFQDMIDIRVDPGKYLQEHNPRLYKYLTAGPGVSLINLPSLPPPPPPSPPSPPQPDDEDLFNSPGWEYDSFFPKRTDEEEWTFSKSKSDQPSPQPDEESKDRQGEENRGTPLNPEGNPRGEPI